MTLSSLEDFLLRTKVESNLCSLCFSALGSKDKGKRRAKGSQKGRAAGSNSGKSIAKEQTKAKDKRFFDRVVAGIKKGYHTPSLPPHILELKNRIYIRIIRFIGGISVMYILYSRLNGVSLFFVYILGFNVFIYMLYNGYIAYQRVRHMRFVLKNTKYLDVKNSP